MRGVLTGSFVVLNTGQILKADAQMGLFGSGASGGYSSHPHQVQSPGSRGGRFFTSKEGKIRYGTPTSASDGPRTRSGKRIDAIAFHHSHEHIDAQTRDWTVEDHIDAYKHHMAQAARTGTRPPNGRHAQMAAHHATIGERKFVQQRQMAFPGIAKSVLAVEWAAKAAQLGLSFASKPRDDVNAPGGRGGRFYASREGKILVTPIQATPENENR